MYTGQVGICLMFLSWFWSYAPVDLNGSEMDPCSMDTFFYFFFQVMHLLVVARCKHTKEIINNSREGVLLIWLDLEDTSLGLCQISRLSLDHCHSKCLLNLDTVSKTKQFDGKQEVIPVLTSNYILQMATIYSKPGSRFKKNHNLQMSTLLIFHLGIKSVLFINCDIKFQ